MWHLSELPKYVLKLFQDVDRYESNDCIRLLLLYRYVGVFQSSDRNVESPQSRLDTMNTKKAVYCTVVFEEFIKELAALSQEHAIQSDEGYQTDWGDQTYISR